MRKSILYRMFFFSLTPVPFLFLLMVGCDVDLASPETGNIQMKAELEPEQISARDTTRLHVWIESTGYSEVQEPSWAGEPKGVEVVGRSTSRQIRYMNGQKSMVLELSLILRPLQKGEIDLPPFQVKTPDGKIHSTNTLKLFVDDRPGGPAIPASPPQQRRHPSPSPGPGRLKDEVVI